MHVFIYLFIPAFLYELIYSFMYIYLSNFLSSIVKRAQHTHLKIISIWCIEVNNYVFSDMKISPNLKQDNVFNAAECSVHWYCDELDLFPRMLI